MNRSLALRPRSPQHPRLLDSPRQSAEALPILPQGLLQQVADEALQLTHATGVAIAFEKGFEFTCHAVAGTSAPEIGSRINVSSGLTGVCVYTSTLQWCNNTELDSRVDADVCRRLGVRAIVIVPLLLGDRLLGLIEVFSRRPYAFGKRDLQALHDLALRISSKIRLGDPSGADLTEASQGSSRPNDDQKEQSFSDKLRRLFRLTLRS